MKLLAIVCLAAAALGCSGRCPEKAVLTAADPSRPTCTAPVEAEAP